MQYIPDNPFLNEKILNTRKFKLVLGKSAKAGAPYLLHISLCRHSLYEIGTALFSNLCDILLGFQLHTGSLGF